ncbi:cupin domain-containing protein [Paracoccus kondratievae]
MSEFFEPDLPQSPQPFFTPAELRDLTSRLYNLQILHERYEPGADTGETMLAHHGSEGGIVIAGEVELTVGDQSRVLKAGDSYLFASNQPHRFRNNPDREAVVVSACTPPYL